MGIETDGGDEPGMINVREGLDPLVAAESLAANAAGAADAANKLFVWFASHGSNLSREQAQHAIAKARAFALTAILHADEILAELEPDEDEDEDEDGEGEDGEDGEDGEGDGEDEEADGGEEA